MKSRRVSEYDGVSSPTAEHNEYRRNTSIFEATNYKERVKRKMQLLREKEMNIHKQRRDLHKKQEILKQIQEMQPSYRVQVNKLIVMPVEDLLKKKN